MTQQELSQHEKDAKQYLVRILKEATWKPCDVNEDHCSNATLPLWFNEAQFKRGQKYFLDNRFGMLASNMYGLLTLLAEPKGLKVLSSTGQSSTPETARKRYVSTILHLVSWYETDLSPGSKSWVSLNRVRKMHVLASNSSKENNIGYITQTDLAMTTFGFMGYALIRPHLLGISHNNDEDRVAFVHFWAVMGHMLGVKEEFNICLHHIETVCIIFRLILRYIFMPLIQLDTPEFRQMLEALFAGMKQFMPHMSYDIQMFNVKRIIGIPGYQFKVDIAKETMCRSIFDIAELTTLREEIFNSTGYIYSNLLLNDGIPLLEIRRDNALNESNQSNSKKSIEITVDDTEYKKHYFATYSKLDENSEDALKWHSLVGLESGDKVAVAMLNPDYWSRYLNDSKFYELSPRDQFIVKIRCRMVRMLDYRIGKYILELGLSLLLYVMRKWQVTKRGQLAIV